VPQSSRHLLQDLNNSIGTEFKKYLEEIRSTELQTVCRPRKYCLPVEAGKSVSVEEVETFYKNKEEEARNKKIQQELRKRGGVRTRGGRGRRQGTGVRTLGKNKEQQPTDVTLEEDSEILPELQEGELENFLDVGDLTGAACGFDVSGCDDFPADNGQDDPDLIQIEEDYSTVPVTIKEDNFCENDYVIVRYDNEMFPGQVITKKDSVYLIRCMEKSGPNWKWPNHADELWYDKVDVFKKIDPANIVPVSSRGHCSIVDPLLGATTISLPQI
jgi:hypothetical protein